jgi:hypothetical protein
VAAGDGAAVGVAATFFVTVGIAGEGLAVSLARGGVAGAGGAAASGTAAVRFAVSSTAGVVEVLAAGGAAATAAVPAFAGARIGIGALRARRYGGNAAAFGDSAGLGEGIGAAGAALGDCSTAAGVLASRAAGASVTLLVASCAGFVARIELVLAEGVRGGFCAACGGVEGAAATRASCAGSACVVADSPTGAAVLAGSALAASPFPSLPVSRQSQAL